MISEELRDCCSIAASSTDCFAAPPRLGLGARPLAECDAGAEGLVEPPIVRQAPVALPSVPRSHESWAMARLDLDARTLAESAAANRGMAEYAASDWPVVAQAPKLAEFAAGALKHCRASV